MTLNEASTQDMIGTYLFDLVCFLDLAGIMGLHSLINQDQYHASLSDKSAKVDPNIGWDGVTKVRAQVLS